MPLLNLVVLGLLGATPKVALTTFTCSEDIGPVLCEAYERRFSSQLTRGREVEVTTQRDIGQLLGLERQRVLLGCSEDATDCAAELAGALGVDGLLSGTVTRSPSGYLVNLKVLRAKDASEWVSASERKPTELELQDALDAIALRFAGALQGHEPPRVGRVLGWTGVGLGVALAAGGGVLVGLSKADAATLRSDVPQGPLDLENTAARGATFQRTGAVLLGVGAGVAVGCALLLLLLPEPSGVAFAPAFSRDSAWVTARWVLP
jgi:hypothetical protein